MAEIEMRHFGNLTENRSEAFGPSPPLPREPHLQPRAGRRLQHRQCTGHIRMERTHRAVRADKVGAENADSHDVSFADPRRTMGGRNGGLSRQPNSQALAADMSMLHPSDGTCRHFWLPIRNRGAVWIVQWHALSTLKHRHVSKLPRTVVDMRFGKCDACPLQPPAHDRGPGPD